MESQLRKRPVKCKGSTEDVVHYFTFMSSELTLLTIDYSVAASAKAPSLAKAASLGHMLA